MGSGQSRGSGSTEPLGLKEQEGTRGGTWGLQGWSSRQLLGELGPNLSIFLPLVPVLALVAPTGSWA